MKKKMRTILLFFLSLSLLTAISAVAAEDFTVLKVDTLVMEKGAETYSLTVKAFVKNNGEADDISVRVVAVDMNGFELQNATLTGHLKKGQTKVLVAVVKIPKDVYENIVRWEWKQ